jgi:hypothetical protein
MLAYMADHPDVRTILNINTHAAMREIRIQRSRRAR